MPNAEQIDKLRAEISDKAREYQRLLDILLNNPPQSVAELFRLKRNMILISRGKTHLINEFKELMQNDNAGINKTF
jgi:hypothetical protein